MFQNIAIYYPTLEFFGGIESVIIQQLKIFRTAGYKCHIITDVPIVRCIDVVSVDKIVIAQGEQRSINLQRAIETTGIEVILINGAAFHSTASDIQAIHKAGAKVVLTIHFSFPSPIIFNDAWGGYKINREIGQVCDAVVTVSKADAKWWRALGCNAFYVQNPFETSAKSSESESRENVIVWVGREVEQKQMHEAFKIVSEIKKEIPDVVLRIVGPALSTSTMNTLQQLDIEKNVQFYYNEKNVSQHYAAAKVHLLTSITESFCLVITEAKSHAIPSVMYSIPFLELVRDGRGIVEVEQHNAKAAALEITKLLRDENYRLELGKQAIGSLDFFNDETVIAGWENVFANLKNPDESIHESDEFNMYIEQIFDAWEYQRTKNQFKIIFFEELSKITRNDGSRLVDGFMRFVIKPLKYIKGKMR